MNQLRSIAAGTDGSVYLGNVNVPPGPNNCVLNVCFQVRSVDTADGAQTLLAGHGYLSSSPIDLVVESNGGVLVLTDLYYSTSEGVVGPRLVRVDPITGAQQLLAGSLTGVVGIAIVPAQVPEPTTTLLVACGLGLLGTACRPGRMQR